MGISIQRPSSLDVSVSNPNDVLYLRGDEDTDGSVRLILSSNDEEPRIELRVNGNFTDVGDLLTDNFTLSQELCITFDREANFVVGRSF